MSATCQPDDLNGAYQYDLNIQSYFWPHVISVRAGGTGAYTLLAAQLSAPDFSPFLFLH